MLSEDQKRILGYFIEEAKDHLNTIEQGLLNLQATIEDTEMVNEVFRAAHSVKGGAAMLGLNSIQRTSHRLEDFFKLMKETPPQADRDLESMLLSIFDGLQEQLEQLQGPYGLSDEQGQAIVAGLEPVFAQTEAHLQKLLENAPLAPESAPTPAPNPAPVTVAASHPETSALQLVFQSDVPALLRDMLATFKQADTEATRQKLVQLCQRFKSIGDQFELSEWNELISLTTLVVASSYQTFRSLASVIIKDLKQAQDLVLAGNASQIMASPELQALAPGQPAASDSDDAALDALLAEALGDDTADGPDLADLFAAAEEEATPTAETEPDDSWLDQVSTTEVSDVDDLEAAFDSLTAEALETSSPGPNHRHGGVEVGDAELNSLADLFEGEPADLEAAWQEEVVDTWSTAAGDQNEELDLQSDLADLLGTADAAETSGDGTDDFASLFGESFDQALGADAESTNGAEPFDAVLDDLNVSGNEHQSSTGADLEDTAATPETEDLDDFFSVESDEPGVPEPSGQSAKADIDNFFDGTLENVSRATAAEAAAAESRGQAADSNVEDLAVDGTATATVPTPEPQPTPTDTEASNHSPNDDLFEDTEANGAADTPMFEGMDFDFAEEPEATQDSEPDDFILDFAEEPETQATAEAEDFSLDFPESAEATAEVELDDIDLDFSEEEAETSAEAEFGEFDFDLEEVSAPDPEATAEQAPEDLEFGTEEFDLTDAVTPSSDLDDLDLGEDIWDDSAAVTAAAAQAVNLPPAEWSTEHQPQGEVPDLGETPFEPEDISAGTVESHGQALEGETAGEDPSDFDDLENLIEDSPPAPEPFPREAIENNFDDLEALLGEESSTSEPNGAFSSPAVNPAEAKGDDLDEFSDLEKLLEDTDQLGGSSPSLTNRRGGAGQVARRTPRRNNTVTDQTMRVSVSHLDILSNLVGELVVNRNSLEQDQERLRQFLDNLLGQVQQLNDVGQRMRDLYERSLLESSLISSRQALTPNTSNHNGGDSHATGATFDALEMDRFTGFHTLSQEMIELIVRVREAASDIEFTIDSSDQITRQFRQVTTQLQEGLNKARMVPFGQTADRLPRAVRDISLKCGKEARLVVEGRDTLIDKMILERLYDPVTHLVNNAITHGIESPSEREARGKSRQGTITIRAFYQGNQTVIYIADDGGGINPDIVKSKALKRGLMTSAEAESMSEIEVYDLLFLPGFSTRDQADAFSGRGVGMDVVRTALADIRGAITIESNLGKGTSFTIRLPLTLSITKALSCVNNQARIAFPMDGVEDMFDAPKDRIQTNDQGVSCILWRDTLLPFRPLSELMQFNRSLGRGRVYGGSSDDNTLSIVVLRSASTFIGLQVDQVIGEQEIVIKQLEGPVPKPTGIAGATVMGDGRVMPIADVLELIDLSTGRVRRDQATSLWSQTEEAQEAARAMDREEPTVLIVDDSITVRELLSMSFNKVGYRVEQARDGQEAWEKLRAGLPCDLVFCDIEMPRMDGLELLSRLQKDEQLAQIPIAMLTSRGADRHRQMAVDLGASGYFTKPYLEEMLLDAAQRMLNGESMINATTAAQTQEA